MEPTEPRDPSGRSPGWAGLGALLALGAARNVMRRVTADRPEHDVPAPTPAAHGSQGRLVRWVALGMVLALVLTGIAVIAARSGGDGTPSAWDPRVAELVRFVERERGLTFQHPVRVDFLSDRDFRAQVTSNDAPTADDTESLHHLEGLFRALGLVEGELDLQKATNQLTGEGVIGLYSPEEDRVFVRGGRITPGMRPTIVHELTHALQAQHFDLLRTTDTSGEDTAFRTLVEADALRVEDAYVQSLPDADRKVIDAEEQQQAGGADFAGVPPILTELFALPYVFGPPFIDALVADGGTKAVDRAFRTPPTTEEDILDPTSYLAGEQPAKVAAPKVGAGEKAVDQPDDFGMLSLLLVLGERLPFPQAWAAVDGWKGDASIGYRSKGRDCIRVRTLLDTPADAAELRDAVQAWAAGRPTAVTTITGRTVQFSSCDPGTTTATNDPSRPRTFEVLQLRVELLASLQEGGLPHPVAECAADTVLRDHDPKQLLDVVTIADPTDARIVRLQRDVVGSIQACQKTA
jgi:hypothetical protein